MKEDLENKMQKFVEDLFNYGVTLNELSMVKDIFNDGLDYLKDLINEGMSSSDEMIFHNIK
jgi:aspartate oxidase